MIFNLFKRRKTDMWLIAGLGNPGNKYKDNRHNIGFMVADELARDNNFSSFKSKFNGEFAEGMIGAEKVVILKPMTYMNESGLSVGALAKFYKIQVERIIVFYDELDLPPGKVKVKQGGGSGGHNGIKSIDAHLGDKNYWRVRLGIGHPGDKDRVSGYVLSDFSKAEQKWLPDFIDTVVRFSDNLLHGKDADFMTRVSENFKV